jgi:hypothetical protein
LPPFIHIGQRTDKRRRFVALKRLSSDRWALTAEPLLEFVARNERHAAVDFGNDSVGGGEHRARRNAYGQATPRA